MGDTKRALMLLAIDQRLKGVLVESADRTALNLLGKAFHGLCPDQPAPPLVEVPLTVTEPGLLGSLDLQRALETGSRSLQRGLLSASHTGVLNVRNVNLLDPRLASLIAAAADAGEVNVQREGIGETCPSRFVLIGTIDPDGGEVNRDLRERVGLIVNCASRYSVEEAAEAAEKSMRFDADPRRFVEEYSIESAALRAAVSEARARRPFVRASQEAIRRIAEIAIRLGVEGNHADFFALCAAQSNAALEGREEVIDEDIAVAIRFVLLARATRDPRNEDPGEGDSQHHEQENAGDEGDGVPEPRSAPAEELVIAALDAQPPDGALLSSARARRRATTGKRSSAEDSARGRQIRSTSTRTGHAPVAIAATLRAAAPFQLARSRKTTGNPRRPLRMRLRPDDLRFKVFKRRTGSLFIFAVDTSGSMAVNRMAQAKGALARLLQTAYRCRDKVALISFRQSKAEVLLAPTRGVELVKRLVDAMPSGGGTPIAAALEKSLELARHSRLQGLTEAVILLFTDGRANVALHSHPATDTHVQMHEELRHLGEILRLEGVEAAIIDTRLRFVSAGEGQALADILGARYFYLPQGDPSAVYDAVRSVSREVVE